MKLKFGLIVLFLVNVGQGHSFSIIDVFHSIQSWGLRWQGYRSYRIDVPIVNNTKCRIAFTAHVNPKVSNFTLLLHGFGDSRYAWGKWIKLYKDHPEYTSFIAMDWPQHGDSNCESIVDPHEIAGVIETFIKTYNRPINRIIAISLGVAPAALLSSKFPEAQQVWLAPPVLEAKYLSPVYKKALEIDNAQKVQEFLDLVLTEKKQFPNFILNSMLKRIQKSQRVLNKIKIDAFQNEIFSQKYNNLIIVTASKDNLLPPVYLDKRVSSLTSHPIKSVNCGHDIFRHCGDEVKNLVEQSRYKINNAKY